ncbi:MAG TPA: SdiA-regulated domain-containing protein [Caulobacteraceae bacterium]
MQSHLIAVGDSLFSAKPDLRWRLPGFLNEVSGLALTPDGRVMGHDDEVAVICELDIERGEVVKKFSVGRPAVTGDFEGVAIGGDGVFYLSTSKGRLYTFREGEDRGFVDFEVYDIGLRHIGEIEGLAFLQAEEKVIIACKTNYTAALQGAVALYAWAPWNPEQSARPWLTIPMYPLAEAVGARTFHPSSLEIDPETGRLVILASRENAMVELDSEGSLLAARTLGEGHRQPEGATILPDGALVIADEGGDADALMTRYARVTP